jgi:membrane protein
MTLGKAPGTSNQPPVWLFAAVVVALGSLGHLYRNADAPARDRPFAGSLSRDERTSVQRERVVEPGRGREARVPWDIPWLGWKDILWRTYQQMGEDRLLAVAAGVVFYALLALFPAVTAFVSFYGLVAKASTINDHLSVAAGLMPAGAVGIVQDQVGRVLAKGDVKLGFAFAFGVGLSLWSANAGMKAIIDALNVVYEETERRGFIRLNLVSLAFTLGAIGALLVALGCIVIFPLAMSGIGLASLTEVIFRIARWPVLITVVILGLAVLYRYGPSRREAKWRWLSLGSVFAALSWMAGSALLSWYLENFANYDAAYGSLGAAIGMMIWMWMSSIVVLLAAQLNSEIEHQTAKDSTIGSEKPLGARGATMADTVGEAKA